MARSLWITVGVLGQMLLPPALVVLAGVAGLLQFLQRAAVPTQQAVDRREGGGHVDTSRWSLELLKAIEWKRLELLCAAYFETLRFRSKVCGAGPDGGVDIHLTLEGEQEPRIVVQCKSRKNSNVGVKPVRELLGVMASARIAEGVFITTSGYTADAQEFAGKNNIHLIDGPDLLAKIRATSDADQRALLELATEGDFRTPTCPSCGLKMVERAAAKTGDLFWGCRNFPQCRTTLPSFSA